MLKKIILTVILLFSLGNIYYTQAVSPAPKVNCIGLPGCVDGVIDSPTDASINNNIGIDLISNIISKTIQFVAVIAVVALIISGFLYILSWGEEEKIRKAKSWIIWSLTGVIISLSAWGIINILDTLAI